MDSDFENCYSNPAKRLKSLRKRASNTCLNYNDNVFEMDTSIDDENFEKSGERGDRTYFPDESDFSDSELMEDFSRNSTMHNETNLRKITGPEENGTVNREQSQSVELLSVRTDTEMSAVADSDAGPSTVTADKDKSKFNYFFV